MQKRKVNGEWVITLTQSERKRLIDAAGVLIDLSTLEANVSAVFAALQEVSDRISEDGVYSETQTTVKANA